MKYLKFPFKDRCIVAIKNDKKTVEITCELATSPIEIFQSLTFRKETDFPIPLILKFSNPNVQSFALSNYDFAVEHICVDEKNIVDKIYVQPSSKSKAQFIQAYSSFSFIILAPLGFIKNYRIQEKTTTILLTSSNRFKS